MTETLSLEGKKYKEHFDKFWEEETTLKWSYLYSEQQPFDYPSICFILSHKLHQ
jgi:hypothetical protein